MSGYEIGSEFPEIEEILKWGSESSKGLCCGIFGCTQRVTIRCEICRGGYCDEHIQWHFHNSKFNGMIIRNE